MLAKGFKIRWLVVMTTVGLLLLGWGVAGYFQAGYRQLADLTQTTGQLRQVSIQRTKGRNAFYYLAFTVGTNPHPFGIRAEDSKQPLTRLQQQMQQASILTIYYTTPRWQASPANFEVYQIAQANSVIYPIEEVQQRALTHGAWALIGWFLLAAIMLWVCLQQRPSLISES